MTKILITGGSGLLGSNLTKNLELLGYEVSWLSRNPKKNKQKSYFWDPEKGDLDLTALKENEIIFHLAGAGVAEKRWTSAHKQEILESRIQSTQLLYKSLKENSHGIKTFIAASAVGFYGNNPPANTLESTKPGNTFLADVCIKWEAESLKIQDLGIRVGIVRIGIILSTQGGFIKELAPIVNLGLAAPLGNGNMQTPWIHINDLSKIFIYLAENKNLSGIFNGVGPKTESNKKLTQLICKNLHRPFFLPGIPEFVLRILFGEIAPMLVANQQISSQKIEDAGFQFQFKTAEEAVYDLIQVSKN
ncbi:MAG: TIGR01777 family oxidoreductase [Bacteroidia bacterium]|nr:TIGR01777 family oxidoreductase [Bacteroidia bacterium]MCF8427135.1 TIGR01777 family oxidoreductase [Bacteroidia bacterium]MCF8445780.1 TIGR01777 family oxidoreductase [Bacteroidia bacterium]